jgi:hypothetical protein
MTTERGRVDLQFSNDPWLLRAVEGVVVHFAQRAGLDAEAQQDLVAAAIQASLDTFKLISANDGMLGMAIRDFPDRVEVTLVHHGEALPSAGLETFAGFTEGESADLSGLVLLSHVDRVLYDTQGGVSRMTLVKYVPQAAAKP